MMRSLVGVASLLLPCPSLAFTTLSIPSRTSFVSLEATRKPFISGNWKLNPQTKEEAIQLAKDIADAVMPTSPDSDVAVFVPYVFIDAAKQAVGNKIEIGAEVSAFKMVKWVHRSTQTLILKLGQGCLSRGKGSIHRCYFGTNGKINGCTMVFGWSL